MSPAENRRARDAVRRSTRASTERPGQIQYVRTPLPPSLKLRRTSRGVPRSPRKRGELANLRAPSAAELLAHAKNTAPLFSIRHSLLAIRPKPHISRVDAREELK